MALLCLGANEGDVPSLRDGWLVAGALAADDVQFARHEAGLLEIEVGIDDISPTGCIRSLSRACITTTILRWQGVGRVRARKELGGWVVSQRRLH